MKEDRILKIKSRKILRNKKELVIPQSASNHVPINHFFLLKLIFSRYPPRACRLKMRRIIKMFAKARLVTEGIT